MYEMKRVNQQYNYIYGKLFNIDRNKQTNKKNEIFFN